MLQLDDFASFDIFKVAKLTQQHPLATVTLSLLQRYDLVNKLSLPLPKVSSFLQARAPLCTDSPWRPGRSKRRPSDLKEHWMHAIGQAIPPPFAWEAVRC